MFGDQFLPGVFILDQRIISVHQANEGDNLCAIVFDEENGPVSFDPHRGSRNPLSAVADRAAKLIEEVRAAGRAFHDPEHSEGDKTLNVALRVSSNPSGADICYFSGENSVRLCHQGFKIRRNYRACQQPWHQKKSP